MPISWTHTFVTLNPGQASPPVAVKTRPTRGGGLLDYAGEEEAQKVTDAIRMLESLGRLQQAQQLRDEFIQQLGARQANGV